MFPNFLGSGSCYLLVFLVILSSCCGEVYCVRCQHCDKDFQSLGRHVWRCKSKVVIDSATISARHSTENIPVEVEVPERSLANNDRLIEPTDDPPDIREGDEELVKEYACYCGKLCKGLRGLQAHKRACRVIDIPDIKALFENPIAQDDNYDDIDDNDVSDEVCDHYEKLSGIKLPKSIAAWELANEHFKTTLNVEDLGNLNDYVRKLQTSIYKYFKDNYGSVKGEINNNFSHYNELSNRKLKATLRNLKNTSADDSEIKYVAKLLRSRLNKDCANYETEYDHEIRFRSDYWKYCKSIFEPEERIKPDTNEEDCYKYFSDKLRHKNKRKSFKTPSWMKALNTPVIDFDLSPPNYPEIASIIRKMKASGSPCPFDQVSIIVLKKCPILRTILWKILKISWETKGIPSLWKAGMTILAYKKGPTNNLDNFRPITLEPVMLKVLTSWMRNRTYKFLASNKLIDEKLQKGFWSGVSGTIEHTETLTYIINQARIKQKSLCATLIDLRNAFGEVHHGLIKEVLNFHHLPPEMGNYILSMYEGFTVSVATDKFITRPIYVQRGVLQGDSLSPLLFNMCFNTLMQTVDQEKIKCSGYIFGNTLSPRNWLQFADDTSIVTALESDNQLLLNLFKKWCIWADLIIRIDKCHTFGIRKKTSKSEQYTPYLLLGTEQVPPVKLGESFVYLGKSFSYDMDNQHVKDELLKILEELIGITNNLPLLPRCKIMILSIYIYSKIKWLLSCYSLDKAWIQQSCDSLVLRYVRKWLNFHPGANTCHLSFPFKKLGLNLSLPSHIYDQCKLTVRRILRASKDSNIRNLYVETHNKNVNTDEIVEKAQSTLSKQPQQACKDLLKEQLQISNWDKFMELKKQNILVKFILENCQISCITTWNNIAKSLPKNLYSFLRRALILALPTNKNLKTWKLIPKEFCPLCKGDIHTQHHILNHCTAAADQQRYLWRHNSVLNGFAYHLSSILTSSLKLYVDIPGFESAEALFNCSQRPDLVFVSTSKITIIELTISFETNLLQSRSYKENKYKYLKENVNNNDKEVELLFVEISSLGFYTEEIKPFKKFLKDWKLDSSHILRKSAETSIRCSYYIYNRRCKDWTLPGLLLFV